MIFETYKSTFIRRMELIPLNGKTIENYVLFVEKFFKEFSTVNHPKDVPSADIEKFLVALGDKSLTQQKQATAALKKFYSLVVGQPKKLSKIHFPKINSKLPGIVPENILWERINAITDPRYKAIFTLIGKTGIRLKECASLKVSDFTKESHRITVREGKGRKDRIIPYGDTVRRALIPYFITRKDSKWMFHGENPENYISPSTIEKKCRELLDMHPHQIRHSVAVHFLENGGDIYALQNIYGHSKVQTTERYARMTDKIFDKALEVFERAA